MTKCRHDDLHFHHHIVSFEIDVKSIEIKCHCNGCGVQMKFLGLPLGVSFAQPTGSLDGDEIRIPICPANEEPQKAPGLIGQVVRAQEAIRGQA
jgi:hypothetical protein